MIRRIEGLLKALKNHEEEVKNGKNSDEVMFQSLMESADPEHDMPPPRPERVHTGEKELPSYSTMMAALVDQVKTAIAEKKVSDEEKFPHILAEVQTHIRKVEDLQTELLQKLHKLEEEEKSKITSESIHTGFDSSSVNKSEPASKPAQDKGKGKVVEVLNPNALEKSKASQSGAEADVDEPTVAPSNADPDSDEEVVVTELGKKFSKIELGDYRACLNFIMANPAIVAERESDGLLVMAFDAELEGKSDFARLCVHQALLLQYCKTLGKDGVGMFFKRITTPGHQAGKVFLDDVQGTYGRIKTRAAQIKKDRDNEPEGVEQIQLHAVEPGTEIKVFVPPPEMLQSEDPEERRCREIFEAFPPGLQRALESGKLDEVNKVLGKMSVEEAEEVVEQLGEGGMLSLQEEIIDTTTEEGKQKLKEIEEEERRIKREEAEAQKEADMIAKEHELAGDPE
jgi:cell division cycle protein 37